MPLLDQVTALLDQDETKAAASLGTFFSAARFVLSKDAWKALATALPDVEKWMTTSMLGPAGRTAEMFTLVTPDTMSARLTTIGLDQSKIDQLTDCISTHLSEAIAPDVFQTLTEKIPALLVKH